MSRYEEDDIGAFRALACLAFWIIVVGALLTIGINVFLNQPVNPLQSFYGGNSQGMMLQQQFIYPQTFKQPIKPLYQRTMPKQHVMDLSGKDEFLKKEIIKEEIKVSSLPHIESIKEVEEVEVEEVEVEKVKDDSFWTTLIKSIFGKKIVYEEKKVFKIRGKGECSTCRLH